MPTGRLSRALRLGGGMRREGMQTPTSQARDVGHPAPAMEAGIADHVCTIEEMVGLLKPKSILDGLNRAA